MAKLGIDFGTTRTVVAVAQDGRYPVVTFDVDGTYTDWMPGHAVRVDGECRYGWDAREPLARGDHPAVRSIKRAIGNRAPDAPVALLGPGAPSGLELLVGFLQTLRDALFTCSNLELGPDETLEAVVAVPANASSRQRFLTLEAFRIAGFQVEAMLNEPTAAAIELAHRNRNMLSERSPKSYVVVYDLGGGTFDTSAVSLRGRRFELLASEGIGRLGGDDFDAILLELCLEKLDVEADAVGAAIGAALLERCREAKETLRPTSRKVLVDVSGLVPGHDSAVVATADLYARCEPLVERTLALVDRLFQQLPAHGIDPDNARELGGLYLVGGASAFPAVGKALRGVHKRKIVVAPQPHAATAVGLAVVADPEAGVLVREAPTRHFGVWREAEGGREKIFDPILAKDSAPSDAPIVVERAYRPRHPVGHLRFMECSALTSAGVPDGDLTPWRSIRFPYDPSLAERAEDRLRDVPVERKVDLASEEIVETYTYSSDGSIRVRIANRTRGYARDYRLDGPGTRSSGA